MISERINRLSVSETLEMSQRSDALRAKGYDIINLSVGQPDFFTPDFIKEAAKKAIDENFTFYPPVAGYNDLRQAIVAKFKHDNNLDFSPEQIVVSNGAKQSLANVILSLVNKDDEVIIPAPYWVTYAELDNIAEGKSVFLRTSVANDFKVTPQQVEEAISYRTKAFLFSSPSNPAGSVYNKKELYELAMVFAKYDRIYVISDEIYEYINFVGHHESIAQFDFLRDRVVVINGVSKAYSMTGWRIGYIGAPLWIAQACEKLQGQYTSGASSISQKAALAALRGGREAVNEMNAAFKKRRDLVLRLLADFPEIHFNIPHGAFYIFPDVSHYFGKSNGDVTIYNARDFSMYLLDKAHVATVPGNAFGEPNCVRFSFATSEEKLLIAFDRISQALGELQ